MRERRLQDLEDYIHSLGTTSLDELCEHFDVSKNTIRRDISTLLEKGTIQKVYGGVTSISQTLIPFENRDTTNKSDKRAIARRAAQFVEGNELIYIDSGTTTRDIIDYLPRTVKLTILTNSLHVINAAANVENISLLTIGNTYKRDTKSFVGTENMQVLDKYNINKAFMAATGVSIESGLTNSDVLEYEIKKKVAEKAQKMFLLADASKFGRSTLLTYSPLNEVDAIVTSKGFPEEYKEYCEANEISVYFGDEV
ncbi:DeoR/GlpR transcriptional regulator [Paenibacillus albidus]|uniref:DeoR/GlpR family DNA-binding transcription regulator n=1 Tax=Paenibacillus albidus TaxID=2041023 RepID=UPI001BEBC98C|nr:DeoR/GlpR family DNA-binding transcription regulator [Paenibacillus albidus]MBT2290367.1 DeoR/GlpR transcriptional regulator [Paenibacillus albidus]